MIKVKNKIQITEKISSLLADEIKKQNDFIKRLSSKPDPKNIEDITFSVKRIKIARYILDNIEYSINNLLNKIECNDILNEIILNNDKDNVFIDIFYDNDNTTNENINIIKGFVLSDNLNNNIAYIYVYDLIEDNIFKDTNIALSIFLIKFDSKELKITFLKNKINNKKNKDASLEQIERIKNFQKDFKYKTVLIRAHISSIVKLDDIKTAHLIKIGKYGHLFSNKESIYSSIMILLSDFKSNNEESIIDKYQRIMKIGNIIKNYRKLVKIENKMNTCKEQGYEIKFLRTMYLIDPERCVLYEKAGSNKKLLININKESIEDLLDTNIFFMNALSHKQEETDFKLKDFLKTPIEIVKTIELLTY